MLIDLHNHTSPASPCSHLPAEELIEAARRGGLDGVCVTDHGCIAGANAAQAAGWRLGFPVFRGVEARTDLGDMLVFGYYQDIPDQTPLVDLVARVHSAGGVVYVAHPYHTTGGWNLYASLRGQGLDLDRDWDQVPVLRELDGVEVVNGQVTGEKNEQARGLAARLNLPGIGGSDAHAAKMVAQAATQFEQPIRSDEELVAALKSSRFQAVRLQG